MDGTVSPPYLLFRQPVCGRSLGERRPVVGPAGDETAPQANSDGDQLDVDAGGLCQVPEVAGV